MRQVTSAAMASAVCLLSVSVRSQDVAPAAVAAPAAPRFTKELERGYRLREQKRDAEAASVFSAILVKDPTNHAALTELGYLNANLKRYSYAVRYLRAASAQDPDNARLRMDLAYAAQAAKQYGVASEQFAFVAGRAGEFQAQAQQALETVKGAGSGQADAKQRRLREQGYEALNRGAKAAASKAFEAAVANDPKDEAALKQLGFINLDAGRLAAAAANFEAARALEPYDYFVALQLGYTYERLQKKDQAREAFGAALASTDEKIHGAAQNALQSAGGPGAPAAATSL